MLHGHSSRSDLCTYLRQVVSVSPKRFILKHLKKIHDTLIIHDEIEKYTFRQANSSFSNKIYNESINMRFCIKLFILTCTLHNSFTEARLLWKVRSEAVQHRRRRRGRALERIAV